MSKHFVCGQYEAAYYAPKNGNWEAPQHLRASTATPKTVANGKVTYREKPVTVPLVNDQGHLINRKYTGVSSFSSLPRPGTHGAKFARWPVVKGNALIPFAGSSTMGFKGIPSNTGFSSTVKLPAECFYSTTR